uniref:NADH dehydrogenase subunit 6 n=1 Tax=Laemobothrion tinnunculi TaxID=1941263 RepID=A0A7T1HF04_9NEOP|nr:NADH dehydrogenase subunit 6 [Laemobothrion tinnunculi]
MNLDTFMIWALCFMTMLSMMFFLSMNNPLFQLISVMTTTFGLSSLCYINKSLSCYSFFLLLIVFSTGLMVIMGICISMTIHNPTHTSFNQYQLNILMFFFGLYFMIKNIQVPQHTFSISSKIYSPLVLWIWSALIFLLLLIMVITLTWISRMKGGGMRYTKTF